MKLVMTESREASFDADELVKAFPNEAAAHESVEAFLREVAETCNIAELVEFTEEDDFDSDYDIEKAPSQPVNEEGK
jgi:hypothetical protein